MMMMKEIINDNKWIIKRVTNRGSEFNDNDNYN